MSNYTPYSVLLDAVKDHRMTVLHEDGLYRHVRFARPGSNMWRFDLITWPYHLVITGDLESYHFSCDRDMFEHFRATPGHINPHYWGRKLQGPTKAKSFSPARYKQLVFEYFRQWDPGHVHPQGALWRSIRRELLDDADSIGEEEAHRRLQEFEFRFEADRFEFASSWEWDLRDWDWHFQLSLHAIIWGIHHWNTYPHMTEADWLREEVKLLKLELKTRDDEYNRGYANAEARYLDELALKMEP